MSEGSGGLVPNFLGPNEIEDERNKKREKEKAAMLSDQEKAARVSTLESSLTPENLTNSLEKISLLGKAKTKEGNKELDRLLTLFEARQAEISSRVARPGASQTRLV